MVAGAEEVGVGGEEGGEFGRVGGGGGGVDGEGGGEGGGGCGGVVCEKFVELEFDVGGDGGRLVRGGGEREVLDGEVEVERGF